ncbi:MAG: ABC transporter ATP-binding protein [Alphaproteobacteria bacterium]
MASNALFAVEDLAVVFNTEAGLVQAVNGISYTVEAGEVVAIVGESGCGKSVSAMAALGLVPSPPGRVVRGKIWFDGKNLLEMSEEEMTQVRGGRIGMIFQEPMTSLNPVLSIGVQLTESMRRHLGLSRAEAVERAKELLEMVGIADPEKRLKQYPHHFSGGMRQRVMIAIALSCHPKLIIADEPTTALDVTIQAQILELMKTLVSDQQVALVIITHNLGVVARYAHRVNVMYAGRIVESGTTAELYRHPRHPYTIGLLNSVPRMDMDREARLVPIEGQPPDLMRLDGGCAYRPRCRWAGEECALSVPPLANLSAEHSAACFRHAAL